MRRFIFGFKVLVVLGTLLNGIAFAKTLVVPQNYPTISKALKSSEPGDSIFVKSGVYKENIQLVDDVILQGEDKFKTIIKGQRKGYTVRGADNAVIKGFTITNGFGGGILCDNASPIIVDNVIKENRGSGIMAVMVLPQIANNIIYGNEWTGIYLEASKSLDTKIDHNVIVENGYAGISSNDGSSVVITNNIIYKNKEYGVHFDKESMQSRFENNNLYDNVLEVSQGFNISESNLYDEPMFVSEVTYMLAELSPCRKMGEEASDLGLHSSAMAYSKPASAISASAPSAPVVKADADSDNDGIPDGNDLCSSDKEDYDGFEDEDGCPDTDNDGDGVLDEEDKCPNEMETFNGFKDADGCPDKKGRRK